MKHNIPIFNFALQNKANNTVDIHIDGDIVDASTQEIMKNWFDDETSVSFRSFRNSVNTTADTTTTYNIKINSYGGHVGDALAMHDLIIELQNKGKIVNTIVQGMCCSSATLLLLAGNNPEMSANSWFMVHTVSGGIYGTVKQIENYATTMRKFNSKIVDLYTSKTGLPTSEIDDLMTAETFMTAQEAKEKGFINKITGDVSFENKISKDKWDYSNMAVLNSYNNSVKPEQNSNEDMKQFFTNLKNEIMNAVGALKPAEGTKPEDLMNLVAAAIAGPIEKMGETMETEITNAVTAANQTVINAAVAEAVKPYTDKVTELETAKGELETAIENLAGKETKTPNDIKVTEPIGAFN